MHPFVETTLLRTITQQPIRKSIDPEEGRQCHLVSFLLKNKIKNNSTCYIKGLLIVVCMLRKKVWKRVCELLIGRETPRGCHKWCHFVIVILKAPNQETWHFCKIFRQRCQTSKLRLKRRKSRLTKWFFQFNLSLLLLENCLVCLVCFFLPFSFHCTTSTRNLKPDSQNISS